MKLFLTVILIFLMSPLAWSNQVFNAKVMLKTSKNADGHPYSQHATGFLIDRASLNSPSLHACNSGVMIVSTNDIFKGTELGSRAKVMFQLEKGSENIFVEANVSVKGRDYFSGASILEPDSESTLINQLQDYGYTPACVGLATTSESAGAVQGFKYFSLKNERFRANTLERGLVGAPALSADQKRIVGMVTRDYFASDASRSTGLKASHLRDVKNYASRIYRGQIQSSKGVFQYLQEDELFAFKGGKDAFAMKPTPFSSTGNVEILGSPEEVSGSPNVRSTYLPMVHKNAFANLAAIVGEGGTFYLKNINGAPASKWNQMKSILERIPERNNPIIEFEVIGASGQREHFMAGNRFVEYLSVIKWIAKSKVAIMDKDRPQLSRKAATAVHNMSRPAASIYNTLASYPINAISNMSTAEKKRIFESMRDQVKLMKAEVWDRRDEVGEFRQRDGATIFEIQKWVISLDKWISVEASKYVRKTLTTEEE